MQAIVTLSLLIFVIAVLYSSAGQAGGSGYLAAMALVGVAPEVMKPSALVLNILVAGVGTFTFWRAGHVSWRLLAPFAIGSVPLALIGGVISLPEFVYRQIVGGVLLLSIYPLIFAPRHPLPAKKAAIPIAVVCGAVIGLLSGLTGMGGGILLTPLLLFMSWADANDAAGASMAFILLNSLAAIAGHIAALRSLPGEIPCWAAAAIGGGIVGSGLGSRYLSAAALRRLLAVVLVIAAIKLMAA